MWSWARQMVCRVVRMFPSRPRRLIPSETRISVPMKRRRQWPRSRRVTWRQGRGARPIRPKWRAGTVRPESLRLPRRVRRTTRQGRRQCRETRLYAVWMRPWFGLIRRRVRRQTRIIRRERRRCRANMTRQTLRHRLRVLVRPTTRRVR